MNIALVFDSCNIHLAECNISGIQLKGSQYYLNNNVNHEVGYIHVHILVGFTRIAVNFKFHSWFANFKLT